MRDWGQRDDEDDNGMMIKKRMVMWMRGSDADRISRGGGMMKKMATDEADQGQYGDAGGVGGRVKVGGGLGRNMIRGRN